MIEARFQFDVPSEPKLPSVISLSLSRDTKIVVDNSGPIPSIHGLTIVEALTLEQGAADG